MAPPPTNSPAPPVTAGSQLTPVPVTSNSSSAITFAHVVAPTVSEAAGEAVAAAWRQPPSAIGGKRKAVAAPNSAVSSAKMSRPRNFLNHQQRLEIIAKKDAEPKWTQVQLARWATVRFGLPKEPSQATIAVLLKKRDQLKAATVQPHTRTIRAPRHPRLEAALLLWVRYLQTTGVPFTGENIRLKASALAIQLGIATTLNFSTGWMSGFVSRHNLHLARAHKKKPVDADDEPVRSVLKSYDPRNVFALHEVSLVYNDLPFDGQQENRTNPDRDRLCVGLAVNVDSSEKLEPLVVSTYRRKLGIFSEIFYNVDGLMTARILEQWLYKLNQRMITIQRKIAVIVSVAPSHFPLHLSHVRLIILGRENSQRAHPLESGVSKSFKALYRKTHLSFAVDQAEDGRARFFDVSISRALLWIKQAWLEVSPELIRTGWAGTGLIATRESAPSTDCADIHPEVVQSLVVSLSQLQLLGDSPIEKLISPPSEAQAHYLYDDATIMRVVADEALEVEDGGPPGGAHGASNDGDDDCRLDISGDGSAFSARRFHDDLHYFDKEPTAEELLANYRGVIWSLDGETERTADHQIVLRFLRQKQAALRLQQHEQQKEQGAEAEPHPSPASIQEPNASPVATEVAVHGAKPSAPVNTDETLVV